MFEEMRRKMERALAFVSQDLAGVKTGRAKPSLIEHVSVEAYPGQKLSLVELASITAPDAHLLVVSPWDKSILSAVAKALQVASLGLNPVVDGEVIRISVPPLTSERREELVKLVRQKIESGRQMLRTVRNETKRLIEEMKGDAGVSEDDIERNLEQVQKVLDEFMGKLEELGKAKEQELLQ